jgi:4-amino-4-deoxy-L-arabinose transferase-like glycosyltransferase
MSYKRTLGIIVLIVLFGFVLRIPYFLHVMQDADEGQYAAVAAVLMDGGLPYANAVENKPPAIFYIYLATFILFGKYNMTAVHMAGFLFTLCTAAVLSILANKLGGKKSALFALFFYLTFTAALYPKMIAANTEIFMALPYTLAVLLLWHAMDKKRRWLYFAAGFVSGISPLFKQVGGVEVIAVSAYFLIAIPVLLGKKRIIPSLAVCINYALGFVSPIIVVVFLFYRKGILSDFIFWTIKYPNRYISSGAASRGFLSQILEEFIPFVLATVILWILAFLWMKRTAADLRFQRNKSESSFPIFLVMWFVASVAVTFLGKRMYGHYFIQIIPSLCLMAALFAGKLLDESSARRRNIWRTAIVALTLIPGIVFVFMAVSFEAVTDTWGKISPDFRPAAEYIKEHTRVEDKIFVWGYFTPLYVYSGRTPSSRFNYTIMHTGYIKGNGPSEKDRADLNWLAAPEVWPMLEKDLKDSPPELIIDTSPGNYHFYGRYPLKNYPLMREFVEKNCMFEKSLAGVDIYRCQSGVKTISNSK